MKKVATIGPKLHRYVQIRYALAIHTISTELGAELRLTVVDLNALLAPQAVTAVPTGIDAVAGKLGL